MLWKLNYLLPTINPWKHLSNFDRLLLILSCVSITAILYDLYTYNLPLKNYHWGFSFLWFLFFTEFGLSLIIQSMKRGTSSLPLEKQNIVLKQIVFLEKLLLIFRLFYLLRASFITFMRSKRLSRMSLYIIILFFLFLFILLFFTEVVGLDL
jgi:hypothetical protein